MTVQKFIAPTLKSAAFATIVVSSLSAGLVSRPVAAADAQLPSNNSGVLPADTPGGMNLSATLSETGSYDTNPLLLFNKIKALYGSVTTPELNFTSKTPTSQLGVDTQLTENLFNQSSFDSTDVHQTIRLGHQTEAWNFGVEQHTDYDTTRTSELLPTGVAGVTVDKSVRHLNLSIAPHLGYSPNATNQFAIDGTLQDAQYDDPVFQNYATASLTPSYTHDFNPRNAGVISLQTQRYQSTSGPHSTVDNIGPSIGWISVLSPRLTGRIAGGVQATRQYGSGVTQRSWTPEYTYSASIAYKDEQDDAILSGDRANYPFGNGTESLLTTLSIKDTHQLNELFSVNAGVSYQTADFQSTLPGSLNYLINGTGGLTYHATDVIDVAGTYQYRYETLNGTSGNAQDHKITIGVVYHPRAWAL